MAREKKIRLSKVIAELNIGRDTAVEYLASNGIEIDANLNTKITESQYNLLRREFKFDKDMKVESEEISHIQKKEKESIEKAYQNQEDQRDTKTQIERIPTRRSKLKGFTITGKLGGFSEKEEEKEQEQEKAEPKEQVKKEEQRRVSDLDTQARSKVQKIKTEYQKLSGPKIVGEKIDLQQFKKKNKKEEKPPVSKVNQGHKRRKRISKVDVKGPSKNKAKNKSRRNNIILKKEPTEEEIQKQIKETLDRLTNKGGKSKGAKHRRQKKEFKKEQQELHEQRIKEEGEILEINEFVTAHELATMMDVPINEVISTCMMLGMMVTMNQRLDAETISIVAEELGFGVNFISADKDIVEQEEDSEDQLEPRCPVVTVMGHVDHGKTSLLDYVRQENVIAGESGGITQHIGAYSVSLADGQKITFLDTPGHEAFTAMRSRGAHITDIAIIVIAADDDIMPQTKEAINHAQAAGVPIVFAINKIDKPDANPEKIKEKLAGMDLLVEDWGGKIQSQDISAKQGTGVKELLEKVILEAEILELRANPNRLASGSVIEATLDKGRGYVTTILIQNGSLRIGDYLLAGRYSGKVKAMYDERGKNVEKAVPSTPVTILGLDGAPQAGDKFNIFEDEREAKQIVSRRTQLQREQSARVQKHITLDEIGRRLALGDFKELNIIVKSDVDGSSEALSGALQNLSNDEVQVNIIHKGVGQITESDVLLASASDGIIVGFQVRSSAKARVLAEREDIEIRMYSIIYDAIDEVKHAIEGMLSPEIKEETTCNVEVREIFKVSKVGTIAGCIVLNGTISVTTKVRVIREGVVLYTGKLGSLKRFQDDVKEVKKGYECGLNIVGHDDVRVGDSLEGFQEVKVRKKLQ